MLDGLDLDPHTILGLGRDATAEEIRDAFRRKSMKYHPDHGGDEWAFRIVVRAHEALNKVGERERMAALRETPDTGRVRLGVYDKKLDPSRLVHVEMVWMRYAVDDVLGLLTHKAEDRNLSGSLNITWPGPDIKDFPQSIPDASLILKTVKATFDELKKRTKPTGAVSHDVDGRFQADVGYPNGQTAWDAFKLFHLGLKARGLGAKQWTRDVTLTRE